MKNRGPRLSRKQLNKLLEEATVDCYNESEELCGLFTMIQNELRVPFETEILRVPVTVERVDLAHNDILAVCRRGRTRQRPCGEPDLILFGMAGRWLTAARRFVPSRVPRCPRVRPTHGWRRVEEDGHRDLPGRTLLTAGGEAGSILWSEVDEWIPAC